MAGITTFCTSSSSSCLPSSSTSSAARATLSLSSNKPFIIPMRLSSTPKFTPLRHKSTRIMSFTSNDIKVGASIEVDGAHWEVLEFLHVKPGEGSTFVRTKIRNYVTGSTVENTFRAGISVNLSLSLCMHKRMGIELTRTRYGINVYEFIALEIWDEL